jgi:mono/diheme cytochrome c family protein
MKNVAKAVLLLSVLLFASRGVSAQDHTRGMKVYADQKCSTCHQVAGKGNAKGKLDDVGSKMSADDIRMWITSPAEMSKKAKAERKPPMKPYTLAKEDLDALVGYMASLKKK